MSGRGPTRCCRVAEAGLFSWLVMAMVLAACGEEALPTPVETTLDRLAEHSGERVIVEGYLVTDGAITWDLHAYDLWLASTPDRDGDGLGDGVVYRRPDPFAVIRIPGRNDGRPNTIRGVGSPWDPEDIVVTSDTSEEIRLNDRIRVVAWVDTESGYPLLWEGRSRCSTAPCEGFTITLLDGPDGEGAASTSPGTSSAPASTTSSAMSTSTTAVITPSPDTDAGNSWSRVSRNSPALGGDGDQVIESVAAGGPGLIAVGFDGSGGDWDAAVWTSSDGLVWSRVPHDEGVFGGPDHQEMISVVAGGPGLVAVGVEYSGGDGDAAVWTSTDGVTWARVPDDEAVFGGPDGQRMNSVTAGGPGLVAVGSDASDGYAAVWVSRDGVTWSRVPDDEAAFGGSDSQAMLGVMPGGPGLVAVGFDGSDGDVDAAVWISSDGVTWSRVPDEQGVFGGPDSQAMRALAAGGPGLVAVGRDSSGGDGDAAVWVSSDGETWTRVPHDEGVFGGPDYQRMNSVTAGGPGLVAVGSDASDGFAAAWVSPDGVTWSRVPHDEAVFGGPENQMMGSVLRWGSGVIAVGFDGIGGGWNAAVWVSPPGA